MGPRGAGRGGPPKTARGRTVGDFGAAMLDEEAELEGASGRDQEVVGDATSVDKCRYIA